MVEEIGDTLEVRNPEDHGGTSFFLSFIRKSELYRIYGELSQVTFFISNLCKEVFVGDTRSQSKIILRLQNLPRCSSLRGGIAIAESTDSGFSLS